MPLPAEFLQGIEDGLEAPQPLVLSEVQVFPDQGHVDALFIGFDDGVRLGLQWEHFGSHSVSIVAQDGERRSPVSRGCGAPDPCRRSSHSHRIGSSGHHALVNPEGSGDRLEPRMNADTELKPGIDSAAFRGHRGTGPRSRL